ncbi:lytic polysaccharide monooxygenase [Aquimarina agarivorans]|uniref:lytic polysaccharide monooxygenase n=1 Tax=Aquimarina agarivorans TaxID=980584 RepID=UPI0002D2A551|nr:lytic polysaccharide monooxygenase [Aquimarina agarivorans]
MALFLMVSQLVFAHGTVTSPPSRVWICFQENPESPDSPACEAAIMGYGTQAFYDWSEVARMDAGGMHRLILPDGNLASAGRPDKYGGLDQVRDDWVTTQVSPGPFTVTWTNSAPHQTLYYDVYITKADWTPDQPLTWDSLERLVRTDPRPAAATDNIDVVLPQRSGKHIIFSVWQRSLTPEAFYSTSDVDFGANALESLPPVATFTTDNGRCGGSNVTFNASGSSDPNGDSLTYSWDFGDGTTAEGVEVSHEFSGSDTASVTLTVSDGQFSTASVETIDLTPDINCTEPVCTFNTPLASALPTINESYTNIYVIGENGPSLSNVDKFNVHWDLGNSGLYQFAFNTNNGFPSWYVDLNSDATQNFGSAEPQITISGSNIDGLDGSYFVGTDGDNFVLVSTQFGFTIYFSNTETEPDCDGSAPTTPVDPTPTNTDPVAVLTSNVTSGTSPLVVTFDASGSTDADGDSLSYTIDYGDGTTGTTATSTHTYTVGNYNAIVTVTDGNGGSDTASVSISVTQDEEDDGDDEEEDTPIVITPAPDNCSFGAPSDTSIPTRIHSYKYSYILGNGGPNLDSVIQFTINWDLRNNGLYQFSFNLNSAPWYIDFSNATQNFNEANPAITLSDTGIPGLDGQYYAAVDGDSFVLVADEYSIYFSNATTAPDCNDTGAKEAADILSISVYPNPATTNFSLISTNDLINSQIIITDLAGKQIKSLNVTESTTNVDFDIADVSTGFYLVRVISSNGSGPVLKLLVK